MKAVSKFLKRNLHWFIVGGVTILCALFIIFGHVSENGQYITLDGNDAQIPEATTKFIEDAEAAMFSIMNEDAPTDEETIKEIRQYVLEEPGNYLKYYMGYLSLIDLKEKTKIIMESDYTNLKFHELILNAGPSDFKNLERRIWYQYTIKKYYAY